MSNARLMVLAYMALWPERFWSSRELMSVFHYTDAGIGHILDSLEQMGGVFRYKAQSVTGNGYPYTLFRVTPSGVRTADALNRRTDA